ncbi:hypothetical protein RCL_jg4976.t1 [Rhizophagus clarus]|uniref:Uncharacterized protein n=1 Tax=Rhizophagus clarus TaxID=94130 RepID=A0A8H3LB08_9GLOM|nr:hypothetical protein RCL_jg4976.t1 [Rhizophagus clarus]
MLLWKFIIAFYRLIPKQFLHSRDKYTHRDNIRIYWKDRDETWKNDTIKKMIKNHLSTVSHFSFIVFFSSQWNSYSSVDDWKTNADTLSRMYKKDQQTLAVL